MRNLGFIFLTIFSFLNFYGQDTSVLKREPYKLSLAVDKDTFYEEEIQAVPYIFPNNSVQVYPGETIFIEVEQENGAIKKMTAVKENKDPQKTLVISFAQTTKNKAHESMMLKIKNPFSQTLKYKASIFLFKQKKWTPTDVYPIEPGLFGIEIWPDLITSIGVGDWSFQSK